MAMRSLSMRPIRRTTDGVFSFFPKRKNGFSASSMRAALQTMGGVWVIAL